MSKPTIAIFDFDNTLTKRDSLLPFLSISGGDKPSAWASRSRFFWGMLLMSPVLTAYALKLIPNWRAKEAVLTHFLSGMTTQQLHRLAEKFAVKDIPKLLRPEAIKRLRYHQEQGHYTILVSASLEAYLVPWANIIGIDQVIGTKLESQSNILTGPIQGKNCYGLEKVDIAWGLEGVALYYIFQYLEAQSITLYQAVLIHTASGLIGALSMLPGGIGGAETASISLSTLYGATQSQAVAATLLIRLLTLWFAVAVGIFAMLLDRK